MKNSNYFKYGNKFYIRLSDDYTKEFFSAISGMDNLCITLKLYTGEYIQLGHYDKETDYIIVPNSINYDDTLIICYPKTVKELYGYNTFNPDWDDLVYYRIIYIGADVKSHVIEISY